MLRQTLLIFTAALFFLNVGNVYSSALSQHEEECYAVAMVAYDTVINSSLGLPLDEVIDSMVKNGAGNTIDIYQDYLILVVMDAYNWQGSPHTFAVKTLYQCAADHENIAHGL
ncbi:MAG TPA: hypothetical protein ENK06_07755 [Gammaproteobacteria bacterium]|nr:hypothetical protein [Gammaproteobacteria bacterium]